MTYYIILTTDSETGHIYTTKEAAVKARRFFKDIGVFISFHVGGEDCIDIWAGHPVD